MRAPRSATTPVSQHLSLLVAILAFSGCSTPMSLKEQQESIAMLRKEHRVFLYVLDFENSGRLTNPDVIQSVIAEHNKRLPSTGVSKKKEREPFEKIVLVSLGWNHTRGRVVDEYIRFAVAYTEHVYGERKDTPPKTAVLCVSWDSRGGAVERAAQGLLMGETVPRLVGFVPDRILFPFSFWAKGLSGNN